MPEPKLSVAEFSAKIKSKYPQYKDVDDSVLVGKMLDKYPVYSEQVDFDVKKKELSEASASQSLAEPSASAISAEVPAAFGEIPKFEGTQDVAKPSDSDTPNWYNIAKSSLGQTYEIGKSALLKAASYASPLSTTLTREAIDVQAKSAIDKIRDEGPKFEQTFTESIAQGKFGDAALQAEEFLLGTAPLAITSAAITLGTGGLGAPVSLALMGGYGAQSAHLDAKGEKFYEDMSPLVRAGYTGAMGGLEVLGEGIGGKILSGAVKKLAAQQITKQAFEQTAKEIAKGALKSNGVAVTEEALAEFTTGFGQSAVDQYARTGDVNLGDAFRQGFEGAAMGAVGGAVFNTPSTIADATALANSVGRDMKNAKARTEINKYKEKLDASSTVEEQDYYSQKLAESIKTRTRNATDDAKFYEYVGTQNPQDLERFLEIDNEIKRYASMAKVIKDTEATKDIKAKVGGLIQQQKDLESKYSAYDTQEEAGIPSPIVEGEAPIEVQPIEGAGQETPEAGGVLQVPVEEGAEATAQTEVIAPIEATVFAAPFYDTKVNNIEEARAIRQSEPYINNLDTVRNASSLFNLEIENIDESIGGFVNEAGDKIVEISNIIRVKGTPKDVQNYAAFLATSSPETQEATIAATYVEPDSETHNIDELTISVSDVDGAIEALKENDIYDFTINDSNNTITFLDFSKGADGDFMDNVGKFAKSLERKNISYEKRDIRAIDSKYIGPREREGIFSRIQETLVQQGQTGTELYKQVEQAIARNQEFLAKTSAPISEAIVTEEITEQVVEQPIERAPVKNKLGLDEDTIDRSIGNAFRLLRKAKSDVQIITHNSTADYNKAIAEKSNLGVDETAVEKGRYIPSRREIHINLQEVDTVTPFHEVFHAIFLDRYSKGDQATRERVAKNFYTQLRGILMDGTANDRILAESADIFASENGYSINEQPEEFLAQIAGYLSNNGNKISKSTTDKIIQWMTNFINKFVPGIKISSRGELIDFMNSFSGAMFELTGKPMAPVINLKSTNDLLDSASRGAFTISYFEDTDQYKKFVDDGLVVNNYNLDQIAGQSVATHQPDNFMVGDVKLGDKLIVEGDGGVYFVLKFGEVWASGRASSASGIAKAINWSRENSTDGKGRMLLARGTTPKLMSSTKGVKGGMQIIEEMVDRNLIPRKDFRASLIRVGKKYGIDFSGNDSMTSIKNDIEQKFMKPSDSTFAKRGSFFEDLISDISSTSAASKENIDGIRKFLGSKKRISFSKEGITSSIAELMTERMLIDLPSSHAYAVIEVDNDVKVEKSKKHDSYPYSIVQVDGKRPTLYLLKDRPKAVPSLLTKDGEPATNAKVGFAQMGYGRAIVNPALAAEAQQQNKPIESLLKESQSKQYKEGIQAAEISQEIDKNVSSDATWKARERNQFERFVDLSRIAIQDSLFGVIKIQEDIEYAKGNPVGLDEDFRNAEVLMHGKAKFDLNESEKLAKDVVKSIKKANIELESFDELIYALHAQERNRYLRIQSTDISKSIKDLRKNSKYDAAKVSEATGIAVEDYLKIEDGTIERGITNEELVNILTFLGTTPSQFFYEYSLVKNGSGMSDAESQLILSSYGLDKYNPNIDKLSPDILDAVKNTYKIVADTRNRMLEFGLETQETIDAFNNTYKYYVPLRGFAEDDNSGNIIDGGRSLEVRGREKRALGRESKAESPFLQTVIQNQSTIIRGRKNEVAYRLYQLAEKNPNTDIWTTINPSVNKEYKKQITPKGIKLVAKSISDYILDPSNFAVRVGGEYRFIQFQDPAIAEALRGANVVKADFIAKYLGGFNRFLSSYITTYDPEFVLRNFSRDIQTAVINAVSEQEIEGGLLKGKNITNKIVKSVPNSIKAIFKMSGKDAKATSEFDKYYNEFLEDGAKTEWFYSKSVDELRDDVNKLMSGKGESAREAVGNFVERINSSVENGVRLAAYIESRKVGVSRDKAAELAKNLTVNFNKKGSLGTVANSLYLFFNASVQGTSRLIRTLKPQFKKNDDGSRSMQVTTAQKIAISMFVAGSIMSVINEALSDDDEDGKSFYSKIPDFEKERNIIIMSPNGKDYIKIPLPYGLNVFYVAGNAMADAGQGIKSIGAVASNILKAAVGSFSPINFPSSEDFSSWLVKFVMPTIGQIPLSLALNENYFGQTIYNENFPTDPTPKPESELGRKNATELNTWISKELNKITGGSEFRSGIIDINPDKTDFVLKTLSGGAGKFAIRSSQSGANLITGNWDKLEASEIPFARVFYGQPKEFTDLQSYFDKRIEVNQFMEEVRADKVTGADKDRIREMYKVSKAVDVALRNLRKAERTADNIKDAEKREDRLDELERKRYAQITNFQKAYEKYKIDKL
jgi:transcriptional regulator with XRE-family HTH domain